MGRPTVDHLFNSQVRVWRYGVEKDNLGAERRVYTPDPTLHGASINRSVAPSTDAGAGIAPVGRLRLYVRPDLVVEPRDVLQVVEGPEAGLNWEVDDPPTHPRGHHTQLDVIAWHGDLPPVTES